MKSLRRLILSIKNTVIKDIVDTNRFDIVTDSSGEILATNGAYGHNGKLNGSTITWDGVSIGYSDSEEMMASDNLHQGEKFHTSVVTG